MKRVFSSESLADAGHVKAVLEQQGIGCFIRNEQLSGALGEVPFLECMPEVWVYDDDDEARARNVVRDVTSPSPAEAPAWRCAACGERNEGHFAACWQCGAQDGDTAATDETGPG